MELEIVIGLDKRAPRKRPQKKGAKVVKKKVVLEGEVKEYSIGDRLMPQE